jgi:hypothetical protein
MQWARLVSAHALPYWIGGINSREAGMSVPLDDAGIANVDMF